MKISCFTILIIFIIMESGTAVNLQYPVSLHTNKTSPEFCNWNSGLVHFRVQRTDLFDQAAVFQQYFNIRSLDFFQDDF